MWKQLCNHQEGVMCSVFDVVCLLTIGALGRKNCPVIPESKILRSVEGWISLFITWLHISFMKFECNTVLSPPSLSTIIVLCTDEFIDLGTGTFWVGVGKV